MASSLAASCSMASWIRPRPLSSKHDLMHLIAFPLMVDWSERGRRHSAVQAQAPFWDKICSQLRPRQENASPWLRCLPSADAVPRDPRAQRVRLGDRCRRLGQFTVDRIRAPVAPPLSLSCWFALCLVEDWDSGSWSLGRKVSELRSQHDAGDEGAPTRVSSNGVGGGPRAWMIRERGRHRVYWSP